MSTLRSDGEELLGLTLPPPPPPPCNRRRPPPPPLLLLLLLPAAGLTLDAYGAAHTAVRFETTAKRRCAAEAAATAADCRCCCCCCCCASRLAAITVSGGVSSAFTSAYAPLTFASHPDTPVIVTALGGTPAVCATASRSMGPRAGSIIAAHGTAPASVTVISTDSAFTPLTLSGRGDSVPDELGVDDAVAWDDLLGDGVDDAVPLRESDAEDATDAEDVSDEDGERVPLLVPLSVLALDDEPVIVIVIVMVPVRVEDIVAVSDDVSVAVFMLLTLGVALLVRDVV